jgi:hypothetical protein
MTNLRAAENRGTGAAGELVYRQARRAVVLAVWGGALALVGYLGFMAANHWVPNDSEKLLDDYDIISNLDKYDEVGDIEFLKVLKSQRTFADHDDQPEK